MSQPRIGFVTCVHPFYELPAVAEATQRAIGELRQSGCEVVASIPRNFHDAGEAARRFRQSEIDLVVLFFCTWVAEDITLALARELMDVPMLLWALPYLDRDVPMPSPMSGLTSSGSNIRRLGKRFLHQVGGVTRDNVEKSGARPEWRLWCGNCEGPGLGLSATHAPGCWTWRWMRRKFGRRLALRLCNWISICS